MLKTCTTTPEMSIASAKIKRYINLNSMPSMKLNFCVHRSARNVEKGSLAVETCGQVFHSVARSEITPSRYRNKLNTYADLCLRKIFILNSLIRVCRFCIIRFMKPLYKQVIHILQSSHIALCCWSKSELHPLVDGLLGWRQDFSSKPKHQASCVAKNLIFEAIITQAEVPNLSEAAKIALLQEGMREAKRNERGGLAICIVGVIVGVAGFFTGSYVQSATDLGIHLGIVGIAIAAVGFVLYFYYARIYLRFAGQLVSLASRSAHPCPQCGKALPEGEYSFCPFCGSPLKS
jgi:hypothetical protein